MIGRKADGRRCPPRPAGRDWASRMRIRIGAVGGSGVWRARRLRRMRARGGPPTTTFGGVLPWQPAPVARPFPSGPRPCSRPRCHPGPSTEGGARGQRAGHSGGPGSPVGPGSLLRAKPQPAAAFPAAVVPLTRCRLLWHRGLPSQGSNARQAAEGTLVSFLHLIYFHPEYPGAGAGARAAGRTRVLEEGAMSSTAASPFTSTEPCSCLG